MSYKDLWFDSYVELLNRYEDDGLPPKEAEDRAADEAYEHSYERLAGQADFLRKQAKETR